MKKKRKEHQDYINNKRIKLDKTDNNSFKEEPVKENDALKEDSDEVVQDSETDSEENSKMEVVSFFKNYF